MKAAMNRFMASALLTLSLMPSAFAQNLLVSNATVHTMTDAGILMNTDVLIADGKIQRIGQNLPVDPDVQHIDAAGAPLTPAFFAGVTVSGLSEVEAVKEAVDSEYNELFTQLLHPEFDVRTAYNPLSSVIPITRIEGFGYTLLAATRGDRSVSGLGGLVRFDGGFDSFEGKPVLFVELTGHAASSVGGSRAVHWMLLRQAFDDLDEENDDLMSPIGRKTLELVKDKGLFVFHVNRAADIVQTLKFAKRHDLKAVIHGGREAWMVAERLASAQVPVIINALDNLPADFDSLGARLDNAALLDAAGVTVMFSSGETHNARKVRQVAGNAVANGLDHSAALRAVTATPASVFGGNGRTVERGAQADLVLWSGDPLDVTSLATQVIIGGKPDPMKSRQTLLRDRYLPTNSDLPRAYIKP